jgi:hypothetical protein
LEARRKAIANEMVSLQAIPRVAREIRPLTTRLKELEEREIIPYRGTWGVEDTYSRGDFTTHDGSLWLTRRDCTGYFNCDLDPVPSMNFDNAEVLATMVLNPRDEIRELLHADRVSH